MLLGMNGIRVGCDFPLWMQYALVIYMISFIVLFGNFYATMYLKHGRISPTISVNCQKDAKNSLQKQSIKQKRN